VDGQLEEVVDRLVPARAVAAISRVKVLAGLDISETRAPQDGGCRLELSVDRKRWIDARVAIIPTHRGERLCVRLLGVGAEAVTLDTLGLDAHDLTLVRSIIERPHGLVLVTGATGSGKSTTLYAALRDLVRPERNLLTIEDPVEYRVPGVSQIQVDHDGRVGFAAALRSVLRHDPDILLVGEIRDAETAALALQAASTGHLVLATLHTNTAVDAPGRLRDLGCPPWLVAATLRLVVNQRLMPRLCRTCRQEEPGLGWTAPGCPACSGRGYRGRVPVFELLPIDRERADAIANGVVAGDVLAAGAGHRPLDADLTRKADQGLIDHRCLLAEAVA
jgi:type II secretory ATPase GspE/PulE/Tfp pilus assembly ATPase PilB-like protein